MAGTGPAPAETRRRRNEPARGEWVDLHELEKPVLGSPNPRWPKHVRDLWAAWRRDPVTAQYSSSDLAAVRELARQFDDLQPNEQRLRMDGLGLTPKGKRDLRWRVPVGQPAAAAAPSKPSRSSASSRRARLTVVK